MSSTDNQDLVIVIRIPRTKLRDGGRKRWENVSKRERKKVLSVAAKSGWAKLTPEQRSAEMKRRAKVRKRNRQEKEGR